VFDLVAQLLLHLMSNVRQTFHAALHRSPAALVIQWTSLSFEARRAAAASVLQDRIDIMHSGRCFDAHTLYIHRGTGTSHSADSTRSLPLLLLHSLVLDTACSSRCVT